MQPVHSMRSHSTRQIRHQPVLVKEDISVSSEARDLEIEPLWDQMLCAMKRQRGCMGLDCRRTDGGYCIHSHWSSLHEFTDWTQATIFMIVAAGIDNRQVSVQPVQISQANQVAA